jgi:hypothetical protein
MYIEIVAVNFENEQKHINALRGQKNIFFLVLKLAVYTSTVRAFNDKHTSLNVSSLKLNGPSNCH